MDKMTDDELRAFREQKVIELKQRARELRPAQTPHGTVYSHIFFRTIITRRKNRALRLSAVSMPHQLLPQDSTGENTPRDFLLAVKKEGYGRINESVDGRDYIRWTGDGRYSFADAPLGRHGEVLVPRRSCAISSHNKFLHQHANLIIKSQSVTEEIGNDEWLVCDTGPGVHPLQIDLYWGEDDPHGAIGRQRSRPHGTWMEYAFEVEVTAKR